MKSRLLSSRDANAESPVEHLKSRIALSGPISPRLNVKCFE